MFEFIEFWIRVRQGGICRNAEQSTWKLIINNDFSLASGNHSGINILWGASEREKEKWMVILADAKM